MGRVIYLSVGEQGLDQIRPLWECLIEHLKTRSTFFKRWFKSRTFDERKSELLKKSAGGKLHVDLALDDGHCIGYCVSSVSDEAGEIDSIFVEECHRSRGIGGQLMRRALSWMEDENAQIVKVSASVGNEEALPFYMHYGFLPKNIVLEQPK
jgi:diamine N-acetyltransferase